MKRLLTLAVLAIAALMISPANVEARKRCMNCQYGTGLLAHFDFKDCHDLPMAGGFHCKSVDFVPVTVDAKSYR